jgi:hypothetical protein
MKDQKQNIEISFADSIKKIKGFNWPIHADGVRPLAYSHKESSLYTVRYDNLKLKVHGHEVYITTNKEYRVSTISIKINEDNLTFEQMKKEAIQFAKDNYFENKEYSNFLKEIESWKPEETLLKPVFKKTTQNSKADSPSKFSGWDRRHCFSMFKLKTDFKLIIESTEYENNKWSLNLTFSFLTSM